MENYDGSPLPENEKNKFEKEYRQPNLPVDLENRVVKELRAKNAFRLQLFQAKPFLKPVFLALVMAAIFLIGYQTGSRKTSSLSPTPHTSPYLLLLSNPPGFIQGTSHAKEYGKWFQTIGDKNAQGEELKDEGWTVKMENNSTSFRQSLEQENRVTGYFIINASSDKEALSIAATCPHIRYNGVITVRPIQLNQ